MDTWATSSLTPQIVTGWIDDPELFERTFPMDLRPQGPEICAGLSERCCALATERFTGRSSGSQLALQYSRPQRPTPERRRASSRAPIWRSSIRVR